MQHSSVFHGIKLFGEIRQNYEVNLATFLRFDNIISYGE